MEFYAGAAAVGLFAGAVVGQATGRVVSKTLDLAVAGAGRAYENIASKDPNDPETRYVFEALEAMDVNSKMRMTNALVQSLEAQYNFRASDPVRTNDPIQLCTHEVKVALDSIDECLDQIRIELEAHHARFMYKWRSSNVEKHLKILKLRLDVLDRRLDMLGKCRQAAEKAPAITTPSISSLLPSSSTPPAPSE